MANYTDPLLMLSITGWNTMIGYIDYMQGDTHLKEMLPALDSEQLGKLNNLIINAYDLARDDRACNSFIKDLLASSNSRASTNYTMNDFYNAASTAGYFLGSFSSIPYNDPMYPYINGTLGLYLLLHPNILAPSRGGVSNCPKEFPCHVSAVSSFVPG
jgi:hypothetical protein